MVFRRDNKSDSFQRQMSAIRQQIGSEEEADQPPAQRDARYPADRPSNQYVAPTNESTSGAYGFSDFASSVSPQSFSAQDQLVPVAPALPAIPTVDAQTTVIAHDTIWKGEIQSNGTVHVHGRFEGSIKATQDVYIAEEADIDAGIVATNVVIAGLAKGTIRCEARFEVLPTGRVSGDIVAPTLVVHEGATVSGQLRMGTQESTETKPTPVVQRRATRGTA
jgi:cytoskeletal protein CcmA (bactofilin family)